MFCRAMEIGLFGNRIAYALKEPYLLVYHRLIMGKEEIDNFFCLIGDILIFFTEMFIELSSTFQMIFVQIGEFDWLSGRQKGSIFLKLF